VQGLWACVRAVTDPGDDVLVPDPGWPNNLSVTQVAVATPRPYQLSPHDGYAITADAIRTSLTPRTRAMIVNSPSNPLGVVATPDQWAELIDLARENGFWLISDECYDELVFSTSSVSPSSLDEQAPILSLFSFSNTYAMTGWRIGYISAPPQAREAIATIQEAVISCLNAPTQHAALAALTGPQTVVSTMRASYRQRRDLALAVLDGRGVPSLPPQGAFYLWLDIRSQRRTSLQFASDLLEHDAVATVPGSAFGSQGEGWLRVSLAPTRTR
jgi:aspartate aminotransferase